MTSANVSVYAATPADYNSVRVRCATANVLNVLNSTLTISGIHFSDSGGGAVQRGGVLVATNSTLQLQDCSFRNSTASRAGGAVALLGSSAIIDSCVFSGNQVRALAAGFPCNTPSCASGGGAVYADTRSLLVLLRSRFSANTVTSVAQYAGGGAVLSDGVALLGACSFDLCTVASQAVVAFGGAVGAGDFMEVVDCVFTRSTLTVGGAGIALGGALYSDNEVVVVSSTFDSNVASVPQSGGFAQGGAVYASVLARVSNCTLSNNTATAPSTAQTGIAVGGGIGSSGDVYAEGTTFLRNSAVVRYNGYAQGGAIYTPNDATVANCTFVANSVSVLSTTQTGLAIGGAVCAAGSSTQSGSVFLANTATVQSGGFAQGGAVYVEDGLTLDNCSFVGNALFGPSTTQSSSLLGAAVCVTADITATVMTVANNTATVAGAGAAEGAGVFAQGSLTCTSCTLAATALWRRPHRPIPAATVAHCSLTRRHWFCCTMSDNLVSAGGSGQALGGAVYVITDAAIYGSSLSRNRAVALSASQAANVAGGSVFGAGSVSLYATSVSGSSAVAFGRSSPVGGGVYVTTTLTADSATIADNTVIASLVTAVANATGGGAFVAGAVQATASTFTGNSVMAAGSGNAQGGALWAQSDVSLTVCTFENNTAAVTLASSSFGASGGALYAFGAVPAIVGSSFIGNSVTATSNGLAAGGAVSAPLGINLSSSALRRNSVVSAAEATGGMAYGGAVATSVAVVTHTQLTDNTATIGLFATSSVRGGSLYCSGGSMITFSTFGTSTVQGGAGPVGGCLFVSGDVSITSTTFSGCGATASQPAATPPAARCVPRLYCYKRLGSTARGSMRSLARRSAVALPLPRRCTQQPSRL